MKKYIISGLVAFALVVGVGSPARAATLEELQVLVAKLTAQLASLQAQLDAAQSSEHGGLWDTIDTNLTVGSQGGAVRVLQEFLISRGFLVMQGGVTGYFGASTKEAVIKYQAAVGMPATGFVGPETRAKINAAMKGDSNSGGGGSSTTQGTISLSARFISSSENRVGVWDVFTPSKGRAGGGDADWKWQVDLRNNGNVDKTISRISVLHESTGEGWSTDYERMYDRANGYPLLVIGDIFENTKYQANLGYILTKGGHLQRLHLYGQPEGREYKEATIRVYFTDGTSVSVKVPKTGGVGTVIAQPGEPLRIITNSTVSPRNVVVLPGKEELFFAIGVNTDLITYATTLEVRFNRVSGSGYFSDYTDRVDLVDRFNKTISAEGGVTYDGNTTIYKFTKLNHKVQTYGEQFYVKVKTKSDMDKSGKFTMTVPKDGLKLEGQTLSGTVTNTITFDPSYTLKKKETTAQESYVKLTNPNGGGVYRHGEFIEIRYETNLNDTNSEGVTLQLFKTTKERGAIWQPVLTIASKLKSGKHSWQIPDTLVDGEYNIFAVGTGVFAGGQSIGDYSDKPIVIKSISADQSSVSEVPKLKITNIYTRDTLNFGSKQRVRWSITPQTDPHVPKVIIVLSNTDRTNLRNIGENKSGYFPYLGSYTGGNLGEINVSIPAESEQYPEGEYLLSLRAADTTPGNLTNNTIIDEVRVKLAKNSSPSEPQRTGSTFLNIDRVRYSKETGNLEVTWKYSGISNTSNRTVGITLTNGDTPTNPIYIGLDRIGSSSVFLRQGKFSINLKSYPETKNIPSGKYTVRLVCNGLVNSPCEADGYDVDTVEI